MRGLLLVVLALAAAGSQAQVVQRCAHRHAENAAPLTSATAAAVTRLQQQRDPRALAVADFLLAGSAAPDSAAARARLHDRARASTDPLLTVLALHRPCVKPGCRGIEAAQWSRLEPANLLAWLALPTTASDGDYLLGQIATHVRHARDYRRESAAVMDDVTSSRPASTDGVLGDSWPLLNLRALAAGCPRELTDVTRAQRCEQVAELLWGTGGSVEQLAALALAEGVQALDPQRRAVWGPRLQALSPVVRRLMRDGSASRPDAEALCAAMRRPDGGGAASSDDARRAWQVLMASGFQSHFFVDPRRRALTR